TVHCRCAMQLPITWPVQSPMQTHFAGLPAGGASMFFVFGPSGQMYRGGPENLSQISPVRRVQRPQALRTRGADVPPFSVQTPPPPPERPAVGTSLRAQD